jgi:hypothetical protein
MKKLLTIFFIFFMKNTYAQTIELYSAQCNRTESCKLCVPDYKEVYQINKSAQVVIFSGTDLKTKKTASQTLSGCSIVDGKNFICGEKKIRTRGDGALIILDNRTIMSNGFIEDRRHLTILDQSGRQLNPELPLKTCQFKKNVFGQYTVIN